MNTLRVILDHLGVTLEEIRSESHERRITDARTMLAAALPITQRQVAVLLGCSQPAVHKMRRKHKQLLHYDKEYREMWEAINSIEGS